RLDDALGHDSRIQFCPQTEAPDIRAGDGGIACVITAAGEIRARVVVVADGLRSPFRHRLGWTVGPRAPHRYGVVAHWTMDAPVVPWVLITVACGVRVDWRLADYDAFQGCQRIQRAMI